MLSKKLSWSGIPYIKKVKIRLFLGIVIAAVGAVVVALCLAPASANGFSFVSHGDSFMEGFYIGTGGGLFGAGIVTAVRQMLLLRNSEKRKKNELEETDERNIFLAARSAQYTFYILVGVLYLAAVIMGLIDTAVAATLVQCLCAALVIFFLVHIVCKKVY